MRPALGVSENGILSSFLFRTVLCPLKFHLIPQSFCIAQVSAGMVFKTLLCGRNLCMLNLTNIFK